MSKIDRSIAKLTKKKREKTKISNIRNEKMNIDGKIYEMLANRIQHNIKWIIHHDLLACITGAQGLFDIQNQSK